MNDSLAIHGWKLVRKEFWKLSTNVFISGFNLSASDKSDITVFTVDSYWQIFYAGAVTPYTNWPFSIVNRTIVSGDQNYEVTLLNNLNLQYQQIYKYADDQKIVWFYEAVIF